jgi:hypothetical protein
MQTRFSTAVRAAVLLMALVAGCSDAPLAPRQRASAPTVTTGSGSRVQAFSGAQADSVMNVLEAGWTRNGHPEYRQARLAWRKTNGVPDSIHVPGPQDPVVITLPNAYLYGEETMRPPPQILSHFEALHFGHHDSYVSVPDGIEGEVTFIGDQAQITATSVTITGNNGSSYAATGGSIAIGSGQIINCGDVVFGSCDSQRHLAGVMVLNDAPTCDAKGNGTVNYYVNNISPPISISYSPISIGGAGNNNQSASAVAFVSSGAGACPSDDAQPKPGPSTDTTSKVPTTPPPGAPAGPPPVYDGPGVPPLPPSYPPPRTAGGMEGFWCEQVDVYVFIGGLRTLFASEIYCYRSV